MATFKKKVTTYKGFKIQQVQENEFLIFTADEWSYGAGMRDAEFEAMSLQEAKDFVDSY